MTETFDRDGFVIVPGLLTQAELSELNRQFDQIIREVLPTMDSGQTYDDRERPETLNTFLVPPDFERDQKFESLASKLRAEPSTLIYAAWLNKPPGSPETVPHQDNALLMRTPSVATLWVALDDVDEQNGCLFHLPGSHLRGYRPHYLLGTDIVDFSAADEAAGVPICLRAGDVAVHHGATIHWAHANLSTRHRRAFQMVYGSVGCIGRDPASFLPLVSKNPDIVDRVLALLSP